MYTYIYVYAKYSAAKLLLFFDINVQKSGKFVNLSPFLLTIFCKTRDFRRKMQIILIKIY